MTTPTSPTAADVGDVLLHTARAYQRLLRSAAPELSPHALSLLRILQRFPELPLTDLVANAGLRPRRVTAVLDVLEERGLVSRRKDPADGRALLVAATEEARAVIGRAESTRDEVATAFFDRMSPADRQTIVTLLLRADDGLRPARKDR